MKHLPHWLREFEKPSSIDECLQCVEVTQVQRRGNA